MEYQQIAAAGFSCGTQYGSPGFFGSGGVLERCLGGTGGLVFGTLLGPEATGPGSTALAVVSGTCVSGFLAAPITHVACVGCVVWGCCLRTT